MRRDLGQMLQIMKIIQQHQETDYLSACERANCDENGADADFFFFFHGPGPSPDPCAGKLG